MPDLATALNKHHAKLAAVHPGTVTLDGTSYTAAVGISPATLELEEGGFRPGEKLTAHISKTDLATAPLPKAVVACASKSWVIESVFGSETWAREWVIVAVR